MSYCNEQRNNCISLNFVRAICEPKYQKNRYKKKIEKSIPNAKYEHMYAMCKA